MAPKAIIPAAKVSTEFTQELIKDLTTLTLKPLLIGFLANDDPAAKMYASWTQKSCEAVGVGFELRVVERNSLEECVVEANQGTVCVNSEMFFA